MIRKKLDMSANDSGVECEGVKAKRSKNSSSDEDDNTQQASGAMQFSVTFEPEFWEKIWSMEQSLSVDLMAIDYKSDKNIGSVYNPLEYAADVHKNFMKKFLRKAPTVLFLGMNPGLFGMCQTSIPFGNVPSVRDWLKVEGEVTRPASEISARPIEGFSCTRVEQSGKRFWGVLEELCEQPENFFRHCFVYNICPLAFLTSSGRNITPPEIKGPAKAQLKTVCVDHLKRAIDVFKPKIIISVGGYANDQIKELKKKQLIPESIDCKLIPHPSPRAVNNQDWVNKAKAWYIENDIIKFFKN